MKCQTKRATHYYFLYAHDASGNTSSADILTAYNPVPVPAALSVVTTPPAAGGFKFIVQASAAQTTLIQATTNLVDPGSRATIATNPPASSAFSFTDTNATAFPTRFYRVVSP